MSHVAAPIRRPRRPWNLSSDEQFIRLRRLATASARRCPLILDGLCLHVLSSFQRTGGRSSGPPPSGAKNVRRGTYQIYDSDRALSTSFAVQPELSRAGHHCLGRSTLSTRHRRRVHRPPPTRHRAR
jgi:hypothetical protein